jgi:predicted AlkP superfamily phosphohydrolase/phosphomutase
MKEKVIVIELDGATWDIIDPMISAGELPNFKILKERSVYGEVNTSYWGSPQIWTAIFTGKTQEKYGTPFFGINRARLKAKRIWEIAAENELRVGVLHSLLSWPPAQIDGFIIPDIFAMGPETHPRKYQFFQRLYLSRHGKNIALQSYYLLRSFLSCGSLDVLVAIFKLLASSLLHPGAVNIFRHRLMVVTKLDHNLFLKLHSRYQPHVTTFHLHALDTVSHKYWRYMNEPGRYSHVIHDFYCEADRFIGKVFKLLEEHTSLVVVSDHGFKEYADGRGKFQLKVPALRKLLNINTSARVVRIGNAFVMNLGGAVQEVDADRLVTELTSAILRDGNTLFINVHKIDENIHFRLNKRILLSKAPMEEAIAFSEAGQVMFGDLFRKMPFVDTGIHAVGRGIFAVCGPKFRQNSDIKKIEIFDITPTLLTLLGLPIAKDMDGDFDKRWFTLEALKSIQPRYIFSYETGSREGQEIAAETYTEQEIEDLEERLKMLGYL